MRADFASQAYFRDPTAEIARMRAAGPIVEVRFPIIGKVWTTTTHEMTERVLKDSRSFAMRRDDGGLAGLQWWMPGILRSLATHMLAMDEPEHRRLQEIVDEAFHRRAILDMEPRIVAIAEELADELFAKGNPADLVDGYARKLPLSVICELLGLPLADRPRFSAWAGSFTRSTGTLGFMSMLPNIVAMKRYMGQRLDITRRDGGEGLIAELVRVEKAGGQISRDEMVSTLFLLLFAGHETTTHLISGAVHELLKTPDLRNWLSENTSRIDGAVEEFLRFVSPVQFTKPRFVRQDMALGASNCARATRSCPCWRPPISIPRPMASRKPSTLQGTLAVTLRSVRVFISAWATSSRAWKAGAHCARCFSAGPTWNWPWTNDRFAGASGRGSRRSSSCRCAAVRRAAR